MTTSFFGLALKERVKPDRLVLLGTRGSMWDILVEEFAAADEDQDEEWRLALIDATDKQNVTQAMLDHARPLAERSLGCACELHLIPYGRDAVEQQEILTRISKTVPSGAVTLDLTHGFRHLAALGLLSGFFLKLVAGLEIAGLYYGALDMTENGITPVVRLDGLLSIQRWIDALDRFDHNGDYGVFAPLLEADGVAPDKAGCLRDAAFFERTFNLSDAQRRIRTFLPVLDSSLPGPSGLFQDALVKRLAWAANGGPTQQQRRLAYFYLGNGDYVRAAIFGYEALISRECERRGLDGHDWKNGREPATDAFEDEVRDKQHTKGVADAFWLLKNLRNSLAHGNPPKDRRLREIVASPQRLPTELRRAIDRLLT